MKDSGTLIKMGGDTYDLLSSSVGSASKGVELRAYILFIPCIMIQEKVKDFVPFFI
jgi:hypothetical protein